MQNMYFYRAFDHVSDACLVHDKRKKSPPGYARKRIMTSLARNRPLSVSRR